MAYGSDSLEKRIKDNIKNYDFNHIFDMIQLNEYLKSISKISGMELLLTSRHGEKVIAVGHWAEYNPDVVLQPGRKIRVAGRTVGHFYVKQEETKEMKQFFDLIVQHIQMLGEASYQNVETIIYVDELEQKLEKERYRIKHGEKEDALTGTLNHTYFSERMKVIDRSEILPVAAIIGNINDWKYVNDHFGDDESDRLIQVIARILKEEAKPEYVIGRMEGDVFYIVIPMAACEEAKTYCENVQRKCNAYEDATLAPSIAFGYVMKTNVEEKLEELFSDAEYEMFQNKFEIKNAPGYKERLTK